MKKVSFLTDPWILGTALVLLTLCIHFAPPLNSMLSMSTEQWNPQGELISYDYMAQNVLIHRSVEPAFVKRPLTTWLIDGLANWGVPLAWGFIFVESIFFLFCGVHVRRNAVLYGLGAKDAVGAQVFFHLLPTALFAYFPPIYTYDEPMQYLFLLLAIGAMVKRNTFAFVLWLSLAMLARESSVILFPSLLWLYFYRARSHPEGKWNSAAMLRAALAFLAPLLVYGLFLWIYLPYTGTLDDSQRDLMGRFSFFDMNFADGDMSGESLSFAFLAMGLPVFLLLRYALRPACTTENKKWIKAMLIGLVLNTAVVLVATKAREARLFVLPLLLVMPLLGTAWRSEIGQHGGFAKLVGTLRHWPYALAFVFFAGIVVLVSDYVFSLSDGVPSANLFHEYFVLQALFMGCCILSDARHRATHLQRTE